MSDTARLLADAADRLFGEHAEAARAAAANGDWPEDAWRAFETAGLAQALLPEDAGGADLVGGLEVLRAAGRHAVPLPTAETLLAHRLLAQAAIPAPPGPLTLALADPEAHGARARVPWARNADALVVVDEAGIALVPLAGASISPADNVAGEPRDRVDLDGRPADRRALPEALDVAAVRRLAALGRAAQLRGALERVLAMTVQYANERKQFGRAIARFQAIQHHLATIAGHVAASGAAVDAAAESGDPLALAAAKARASEAAGEVAALAHQVHGAIGFTEEHTLHHWTKRLWAWREEYGNEAHWWAEIGRGRAVAGGDALWPSIVTA